MVSQVRVLLFPICAAEEVIECITSDSRVEDPTNAAVAEHGKGAVLAAVHKIQDCHHAERKVDRSLLEVHHVFLDKTWPSWWRCRGRSSTTSRATLPTTLTTYRAPALGKAKEYQRSSRICLCIGIIIPLLLILLVIVPNCPSPPASRSRRQALFGKTSMPVASSLDD
ncbi:hypothetical protein EJB05_30617, partial [Eragrostis curvula]